MENLIHVGIHKAGSTFLQKNIFPNVSNISYLGFYNDDFLLNEIIYFQTCSDYNFDINKIKKLINFLEENKKNNRSTLISSEGFTGTIQPQYFGSGIFIELIAKRIKKFIENPKIILILRNQRDAITSLYKDDIQFGYNCDFKEWIFERSKINALDYFKYDKTVEIYHQIFNKENVKIYFYENIFKNKNSLNFFLGDLNLKIDIENYINEKLLSDKSNVSNDYLSTIITKYLNKFMSTKLSKGYTFGKYNIKTYNIWRNSFSKKISKLNLINKEFEDKVFENYLKDLNINNENLFKSLKLQIFDSYKF